MSGLRWSLVSVIGIALIIVAVANRDLVVLRLLPDEFANTFPIPNPIELPLFIVIFAGVILGLLVGFVWEWMRERRHRLEAGKHRREVAKLEREIDEIKRQNSDGDDILALLEER